MPLSDLSRQILQKKNPGRGTVYSIREDPEYIQGIEQVTVQRPSGKITPELPEQPKNQIDGILETINQENLQKQQESESQNDFERSLKLANPEHVDEIDKLMKRGEHPDVINAVVKAKQKKGLLEAFKGGREESVSGLAERTLLGKGLPEPYIPENRIEELIKLATTMGYDLPYFIAGSLAGLFGGPVAPIIGGAGAMALPTFLRQSFLEYLDAGGDKKTFLEKVSNVAKETGKSAVIGAATAGVGKALPFRLKTAGEIATITGVSSGLEQKLPTLEDFENNALMLVGIKAGARVTKAVSEALKNRYETKGELPQDVPEIIIDDVKYTRELPVKEAPISTQLTVRKTPEAQINYLKTLGYPDEEIIKMSGKDRQYLIDNQVTYKEQELKKWGMEAKEPSAFPREHEGMKDIEQIPRTKAEIAEQGGKEQFKIGQRPVPKVYPREHEEIGEELISETTPEITRPKREVKLPELIEIEDKAKSLSQRDFTDYYIKKMNDLFNETNDKYQVVSQYFSKLTEGRNAAQEIWDKLNGVNKTVYKNKNINVNVLNGEILKELNPESKNIIQNLSEFTQEKYPQKQLTVNIGKQPISIAGEKGFRITVPTTEGEINDMFPYDKSVIPSYKELESKGMTRQELWAGHDWFHELAHTLGIGNEKEADLFAVSKMKEWFKWKELPPKIQPVSEIALQTAQERTGEVKTEQATITPPKETVSPVEAREITTTQLEQQYPKAKDVVDGRKIRGIAPNQESIPATFKDYEILPGIREVSMSEFDAPPDITKRNKELAEQIKQSGEISPFIVAIDSKGAYILEGGHRYDAMKILGAKSIPALMVVDKSEVNIKPAEAKPEPVQGEKQPSAERKLSNYQMPAGDVKIATDELIKNGVLKEGAGDTDFISLMFGVAAKYKIVPYTDEYPTEYVQRLVELVDNEVGSKVLLGKLNSEELKNIWNSYVGKTSQTTIKQKQPSARETAIRYEETSKTGLPSQKDYFASSTVHQIGKNTGRILLQSPNPEKSAEELFNIIINNKTSNDEYAVKASEEIKKTRDKADLLNDTVEVSSIIARKDFRLQRKGYKQPSATELKSYEMTQEEYANRIIDVGKPQSEVSAKIQIKNLQKNDKESTYSIEPIKVETGSIPTKTVTKYQIKKKLSPEVAEKERQEWIKVAQEKGLIKQPSAEPKPTTLGIEPKGKPLTWEIINSPEIAKYSREEVERFVRERGESEYPDTDVDKQWKINTEVNDVLQYHSVMSAKKGKPSEAGFLSFGKAKPIRPTTSNPKALAYQKMLDEENIVAKKLAHKTLRERFESFNRNWIDASINLRKKLESLGPDGIKTLDRFILRKGTMAEAERILKEVDDEIFGGLNRAEFDLVANVVQAKRTIAIDAYKTDVKHPGDMGADFAQEFLASFPGKDAQLNKAIDKANLLFEKQQQILDMLYKEGLINFESLEALLSKGDYSLRRFIQHIDPEHIYDFGQGNPISITSSGIQKLAHGSEQLLLKDPRYLFQQTLIRSLSRIFKNRANQELYNLASTNPDNGIVRAIRSNEDVPAGYQKISVVVDGAKKDMIMPNKYAREWIQSDPEISNNLANWLGWVSGAKILRPMATGINPEFTLTNIPRDIAHILLTTTEYSSTLPIGLGQLTKDLITVLPDVIHRRGRWIEHIKEGGGFHNSFTKQGLELTKNLGGDAGKFVNYLSWLGNFSEDITRIAMRERAYKNAKSKGMNDVDAKAYASAVARDYLDFSQGGLHSKALDNVLPYFNAGIQGTRGIFRAARRDKGVFAYKIAQLGGLATGLYLANSFNNPDAMNQISDREKVNNWIITTPFKYKDKDGNERYLYFKIAKDQGQRIFATIFENIVAKLKGDKINMTQISQASDALINVLPSSGTGIPTVDAILGYVLNKDLWRNEDIWKGADVQPGWEQTKYTHPLLAKLGERTGIISPERTKYALQRIFTYRNIYTDMVSGGLSAFFKELPEQVKEKTMQEITSSAPFARRFIGTTYPQVITKEAGQKEQIEENTRRQKINLDFDELIDKYIVETKPENDIIPKGRIEDFIKQQSKADQVRLKLRFKKTIKLYDLPDRKWWIDLSYLSPTVRAHQFWRKYKDAGEDKKKQMHEILKKGVAPGVRSKEFLDELEKIGKP